MRERGVACLDTALSEFAGCGSNGLNRHARLLCRRRIGFVRDEGWDTLFDGFGLKAGIDRVEFHGLEGRPASFECRHDSLLPRRRALSYRLAPCLDDGLHFGRQGRDFEPCSARWFRRRSR